MRGWDPEWIGARTGELRADREVLEAWARETSSEQGYRCNARPEMDCLSEMDRVAA